MTFKGHTDTNGGYRAEMLLSLEELKLFRKLISQDKSRFQARARKMLNKFDNRPGKSTADYSRMKMFNKALNDSIDKLSWLEERREAGRNAKP